MCDSFLYTLLSSLTKLCASPINHKALSCFQVCICYFLYLESFSPLIFSIWKTSIPYFRSSSNSALYIEDYSSFPKQVTLSTGIPQIFLEKIIVFIYLFLVVQGLHSCSGFSLVKRKQGLLSSCRVWASHCSGFSCHGVLALGCAGFGDCRHRGSFVMVPRLQSTVSGVVAQGLSCSEACEIFQDQGFNPCLLHWRADSLPLSHEGSPPTTLKFKFYYSPLYIAEAFIYL